MIVDEPGLMDLKTPELVNTLREEDEANEQRVAALLATLKPRGKRLIISKPEVSAYARGRTTDSGLEIPDIALDHLKEYGVIATILKVSNDLVDPDLVAGNKVLLPEFAGQPIYLDATAPFWIVGESDVYAVITDDSAQP